MSDAQNPPFAPFQPTAPVPPVEQPPSSTAKKPRSRKKKNIPLSSDPAPGERMKQQTAKEVAKRTRKPSTTKRAPKFDLQTILAATVGLKEADMAAFQKGLNLLLDVNKAGRGRVLAALGKVFA